MDALEEVKRVWQATVVPTWTTSAQTAQPSGLPRHRGETPGSRTTSRRWSCAWRRGHNFGQGWGWRTPAWSRCRLSAWRPDKAAAQEIEMRPTTHLAFQHLQAIDMACDGAVTPCILQGRRNGGLILPETGGKTPHLAHSTLLRVCQPRR